MRTIALLLGLAFLVSCQRGGDEAPASDPAPPAQPASAPEPEAPDDEDEDEEYDDEKTGEAEEAVEASSDQEWTDAREVEPYSNAPDLPLLDLAWVRARSDGTHVILTAGATSDLGAYLDYVDPDESYQRGGILAEYWLDTDDDPSTGGTSFWGDDADRTIDGYDYSADVLLGFLYDAADGTMKGMAAAGSTTLDPREVTITGHHATFHVFKRAEEGSGSEFVSRDPDSAMTNWDDLAELDGEMVTIRIPYDRIGVASGDRIRICYREVAQGGLNGAGFSSDRTLILE